MTSLVWVIPGIYYICISSQNEKKIENLPFNLFHVELLPIWDLLSINVLFYNVQLNFRKST